MATIMQSSMDKYLWPLKLLLTYTGFWPLKEDASKAIRYFSNFRIFFSIFFTMTVVVPQALVIIDEWGDIDTLTEVGSMALLMAVIVMKQCYFVFRRVQLRDTYWLLRDLWKLCKTREESESLEYYAWQSMWCTVLYYVCGFCVFIFYVGEPFYIWKFEHRSDDIPVNGTGYERQLFLEHRYWFDPSPSPIFEITYAYQMIAFYSGGHSSHCVDSAIVTMIMLVSAQFRLISIRMKNIGCTLSDGMTFEEISVAWEEIKDCIKHHKRMLRIAEELNTLLGPLVLLQIVITSIQICLSGYAVMNGNHHGVHLMKYICLCTTMIAQLVLYCWPSETLIQDSTGIADTICREIPWFLLPYNLQRDFCLVIIRTHKQCQITALGLQVLSMEKITEVLKAAGSYMALLKSLKEKEQMSTL